jgi:hypothetical protein
MKKKYFFMALLLISIAIYACSKDGLTGPEGPEGQKGATGAAGPAGKDGSVMYSGTGIPATNLATIGDYYLDRNTGQLYGPKTAAGWGTPLTLMGATGATGATGTPGKDGSTTLSGNETPTDAIGKDGDYYLDRSNYLLYGPKTTAGWGIPILLKGASGTQGPTGAAGKDGSIIFSGNGIPGNAIGNNGDYYLDQNTGNLYGPKTVGGWGNPLSLRGANGTNGTNGSNGVDGTNGSVTYSGTTAPSLTVGNNGDYYLDKSAYLLFGPKTNAGWGVPILLRGADGAQGPTGPAGADGTVIYGGDYQPDPALGKIGDYFIGKYTVMLYGPKTVNGWGAGISLRGATGTTGATGTPGTNGKSVLNGFGPPNGGIGLSGDFYIDVTSYTIYGPKTDGDWGSGTSLRGADGNANIQAFETTAQSTFDYTSRTATFDGFNFKVLMNRNTTFNDTTSVFNIPQSAVVAARTGVVLVYLRLKTFSATKQWIQLSYQRNEFGTVQYYNFDTTLSADHAAVRIFASRSTRDALLEIDKVRIVVMPSSATGTLGNVGQQPMLKTMQQLKLRDSDFQRIK